MRNPVILCVDDEIMVLTSLKEQLKNAFNGYDIEVAEDGAEALEIAEELIVDHGELSVVISDYIMPGVKGDEVLSQIHKRFPKARKILLTGQATTDGVTNAVNNANLYRYIGKPWESRDLSLTINEAIKSYNMERQLELQNISLEASNRELSVFTDAMVESMVAAIDTRDTVTAGHSKRLAGYSIALAEAVSRVDYGKYKDTSFTEEQLKELYYAALLHDVGKIGIKESILQKEYRLSGDKQNELLYRFKYLKKCLELKELTGELDDEDKRLLDSMDDNLAFVLEMSRRAYIKDDEKKRVYEISAFTYYEDSECRPLLTKDEVENLIIPSGTLTDKERSIINSHVEHSENILKRIPWTKNLASVPAIASSHHERLDGSGYHLGLKENELCIQTRILSMLDIYEALTALDRPYKPPMSSEKALKIIQEDVEKGKLDCDLYEIFVKEGVYKLFNEAISNH